jgi:predicted ABC-type ATPase
LRSFANRVFNADDRAAELNGGSYRDIPFHIRNKVNQEFERFVRDSIADSRSFALETTPRSSITFEQAKLAGSVGFSVFMIYIAVDTFSRHLERVRRRALVGGHAASDSTPSANLRKQFEESSCRTRSGRERYRKRDNF